MTQSEEHAGSLVRGVGEKDGHVVDEVLNLLSMLNTGSTQASACCEGAVHHVWGDHKDVCL